MKDVTEKYINMIHSFECDFALAISKDSDFDLSELQQQIEEKSNYILLRDSDLLQELSFNLRHRKIKLIEE